MAKYEQCQGTHRVPCVIYLCAAGIGDLVIMGVMVPIGVLDIIGGMVMCGIGVLLHMGVMVPIGVLVIMGVMVVMAVLVIMGVIVIMPPGGVTPGAACAAPASPTAIRRMPARPKQSSSRRILPIVLI
jgi:hypothetical protein